MGSVNKVILVGNLGRDAELRYTPGGAAVATLNLATTEVWNDRNNQRQEKTEWHRVVLWGKQAESLQEYLTKGKQIYVEGRLQTRQWDDDAGKRHWKTEVVVASLEMLSGRSKKATWFMPPSTSPPPWVSIPTGPSGGTCSTASWRPRPSRWSLPAAGDRGDRHEAGEQRNRR